jgi:hypothetical protein
VQPVQDYIKNDETHKYSPDFLFLPFPLLLVGGGTSSEATLPASEPIKGDAERLGSAMSLRKMYRLAHGITGVDAFDLAADVLVVPLRAVPTPKQLLRCGAYRFDAICGIVSYGHDALM